MRDRMKRVEEWFGDKRHQRQAVVALMGVFLLAMSIVYLFWPGGRLWYAFSAGEEISTYLPKEGQYCIEYKDPGMNHRIVSPQDCAVGCFAYPYSTEEELFHSGLQ